MSTMACLDAREGERRGAGLRRRFAALSLALLTLAQMASAADPVVPAGVQAALTLRILEYDRALRSWAGTGLTVGVLTRESGGADDLRQALTGRDVQGVSIKVAEHAFKDSDGAIRWAERSGVRFLCVDADIAGDAAPVLAAARARRLVTLTLSRAQFQSGGVLGLVVRDGKPHILVNLPGAKAAGMDLDPKLLQLSEVVR